jgi:hypothetical protein
MQGWATFPTRVMFANWLKKRTDAAAVRAVAADINKFIVSLQQHSDEEIGMIVALATIVRINLRAAEVLPDAALGHGAPLSPSEQARVETQVARFVRRLQKTEQPRDTAGALIWVHSLRAFRYPELRVLGRHMWTELERGFIHVFRALTFIEDATSKQLPLGSLQGSQFIPLGLEPLDP